MIIGNPMKETGFLIFCSKITSVLVQIIKLL